MEYLLGILCIELFLLLLCVAGIATILMQDRPDERPVQSVMTPFVVEEQSLNKNISITRIPDQDDDFNIGTFQGTNAWK
jgi:hypothetical protein